MRQLIVTVGTVAALVLAGCGTHVVSERGTGTTTTRGAAANPAAAAAPARALTARGRLTYEFEALLVDTFHSKAVSVARGVNFDCAGPDCGPLATQHPYFFTFAHPHGSSLRTVSRHFGSGAFGNYPVPVRVRGKVVACGEGRGFLVTYSEALSFSLACLKPL